MSEIKALESIYATLKLFDWRAQLRMLNWLRERIEADRRSPKCPTK